MKTSSKILTAAIAIIFIYLFVYDTALRAEYLKGDYKSRFYKMEKISTGGFSGIQCNANIVSVQIEKGPAYTVWVNEDFKSKINISMQGDILHIDYTGKKVYDPLYYNNAIIITCPQLNSVTTGNVLIPFVWKPTNFVSYGIATNISGFTQDSLQVKTGAFTEVHLDNNNLQKLNAEVGKNGVSHSKLVIEDNNKLTSGHIIIPGYSELQVTLKNDPKLMITKGDSAVISGTIH